jgi:hypothetical protein
LHKHNLEVLRNSITALPYLLPTRLADGVPEGGASSGGSEGASGGYSLVVGVAEDHPWWGAVVVEDDFRYLASIRQPADLESIDQGGHQAEER